MILIGLSGKTKNEIILKIKEANKLKISEASLFLEFIEEQNRKPIYDLLLRSKIKKIPLVHIRHDFRKDELNFLKEKFKTRYFTIHEINFQHNDILKWEGFYKNLCLEMNYDDFVSKKTKVEKIGGFCVDLAHFKAASDRLSKDFEYIFNKKEKKEYFDCSHLNGYDPKTLIDMHTIYSLENFDYLKSMPKFLFGKVIALEVFNSVKEQLGFKKYLSHFLK